MKNSVQMFLTPKNRIQENKMKIYFYKNIIAQINSVGRRFCCGEGSFNNFIVISVFSLTVSLKERKIMVILS